LLVGSDRSFSQKAITFWDSRIISGHKPFGQKAITKAVEGMDNESYNKGQGLKPMLTVKPERL
jgi:hypothetical protein